MRIIGIVPARAGSKRIPGKNKKLLGGKPLICHILDEIHDSTLFDKILVSTDDADILNMANQYENIDFQKRPDELCTDQSLAIDYVKHILNHYKTENIFFDAFCIIQPTSPFTKLSDIEKSINIFKYNNAESVASVVKLEHSVNPLKLKKIKKGILIPMFEEENGRMSNHELEDVYIRNGSVYLSKIELIRKNKILSEKCFAYVMPFERSIDINEQIDFDFADFLLSKESK